MNLSVLALVQYRWLCIYAVLLLLALVFRCLAPKKPLTNVSEMVACDVQPDSDLHVYLS